VQNGAAQPTGAVINADLIKEMLHEYGKEGASFVHEESSMFAKELYKQAL
jgi:hypothetical protein